MLQRDERDGRSGETGGVQSTPARRARRDAGPDEGQRTEVGGRKSEIRGQTTEGRCASRLEVGGALRSRLEVIRLRPTGYAATRRAWSLVN